MWLDLAVRPRAVVVYGLGDHAEAVVHLALTNRWSHAVRVESVRISYLRRDEVLGAEDPGRSFFTRDMVEHASRVERGAQVEWTGVCLRSPPAGADRVRFELALSARRGLARLRATQVAEVALRAAPSPRLLELPFRGFWRVTQGHTCRTSHRLGGYGMDFAFDFVALDPASGRSVREGFVLTRRNRDTVTFGRPVLAPAEGQVIRVVNDVVDNEGLRDYPRRSFLDEIREPLWSFGNFVIVQMGEREYLLLAHLKQGSVTVQPGDRIRVGDPLASCGNSGNTIEPHLHLQVMDRSDPAHPEVAGLPVAFAHYTEITAQREGERRDSIVRRIERGDPPEQSVIAPAGEPGRGHE